LKQKRTRVDVEQVARVVKLLDREPAKDYESVVLWQQELRDSVQSLIIERLQPALNQKLASFPRETLAEKQELCRWFATELRNNLGLAIRCPKTGQPAALRAHPGNRPAVGRFQLELLGVDQGRLRTKNSTELFAVELMPRNPRIEALSADYWVKKVATKVSTDRNIS